MDLTDAPPAQKKIWPEAKDVEDAPPPANAKEKAKAEKEKKKKLLDVRNNLFLYFLLHFLKVALHAPFKTVMYCKRYHTIAILLTIMMTIFTLTGSKQV